jgi:hypothetical protein
MKPLIMKKSYAYMAVNIDYWYFSFIFIYFRSFYSKALLYNLASHVTQDEEKQNKNKTQYVLDTTIGKQTQIRCTRREP